jgi:hypothetical protein
MRIILAALAFGAYAASPVAAALQTIDFNQEAIANGEQTLTNGAIRTSTSGARIRLTAGGGSANTLPFLDGPLEGRAGGLGACPPVSGVGSGCINNDQDNVTTILNEFIEFGFLDDAAVRLFSLMDLTFRNELHFDITNSDALLLVSVDGGANLQSTFAAVVAAAKAGAYALAETLRLTAIPEAGGGARFYVDVISEVPVPAALPLLLSGVAGLSFASRKKRAA